MKVTNGGYSFTPKFQSFSTFEEAYAAMSSIYVKGYDRYNETPWQTHVFAECERLQPAQELTFNSLVDLDLY